MWFWLVDKVRGVLDFPPLTAPAVPFTHHRYGHFTDDGTGNGMHAPVKVNWQGVDVDYYPDAPLGTREKGATINEDCFPVLDALMSNQSAWHDRVKAAVLDEVYPVYIEYWYDPDEGAALTGEQMWMRLHWESISTDADEGVNFVLEFDEEFPSTHVVDVSGSLEKGVEYVTLVT